jgi:hypothetical protein
MKLHFLLLAFVILLLTSSSFSQTPNKPDSITVAVYPKYNDVSGMHRAFYGKNYREIWATPVKMKIFYLAKEKGGLKITELGGGNQTRSLRLEDSTGNEYALRTVQKYPARAINPFLRGTIVEDVLQDAVTTSHPYAALTVPPMAEALGIPHSHPQIVYVPDDPALGKYRKEFANQVFLFEEQKPLDGTKTDKTEKVQDKLQEDNDTRADQRMLLRARLLDMIIGDWDRHGDQWRWEKLKDSIGTNYVAMPRDRDKVFYSTSGIFPWFAAKSKPQLQPFKDQIKNNAKWNLNNRFFDLYFLNGLSERDWMDEIAFVQAHLTDQVITDALKLMPANVYALSGMELTRKVIARRNNIKEDAFDYYKFLSKNVDVAASDKKEQFTIEEQQDGKVTVTISKLKEGIAGRVIYQRTFDPEITKEVRLYGMGGKDIFTVKGTTLSSIKIRMIGGDDEDSFEVDKNLHNRGKLFVYDRADQKNNLPGSSDAKLLTSTDTAVNKYDKEAFKYDHSAPVLSLGYNTEDGVRLIAGYTIEKQGFRKFPYASRQEFQVGYTLSRQSFIFTYKGDFKQVIGNNDLVVNILSRGPRNVNSFFGLGNEVQFPNSGTRKFNYYRNRYDYSVADIRLSHQYDKWQVTYGVTGEYYTSSAANNQSLFFGEYAPTHPEANLFATKVYAGLVADATYDTRKSVKYPTNGVIWKTNITGLTGVNLSDHTNGQILSTFSFYINPGKDSVFVIANRTGAGIFRGKGEFFQQMNLGGPFSLQGYHTSRFIGNAIVFNDLELRLKLFDMHSYLLPATVGLIAFNDAGRVWLPGEKSNTWHDSYGGGLFIIPYKSFILSAVLGTSPDGSLLYLSSGFRF